MSNMHILDVDPTTGVARIVMHFLTPAGNNPIGTSWATAIVNAGLNNSVMATGVGPGQITSAEKAAVTAGTTFEVVLSVLPTPFSNAARLAQLDALYPAEQARVLGELQARLQYWGFTR